jgi:hypothetical protein
VTDSVSESDSNGLDSYNGSASSGEKCNYEQSEVVQDTNSELIWE